MTIKVDSYRFTDYFTRKLVEHWVDLERPRRIPWSGLSRPLSESRIALVSTGGIALKKDIPFDQEGERRDPWWGDPTYRVIPLGTRAEDIQVCHLHIEPFFAEQDLNCLLPLDRLEQMANEGVIGEPAGSHYSFMGYLLNPDHFLQKTIPSIIENLHRENVDGAILIPA